MSKELVHTGKVGDVYSLENGMLILRRSDRISGMNVKLETIMPNKGKILSQLSTFWLNGPLADITPNHLTNFELDMCIVEDEFIDFVGRSVVVKNLKQVPVEAIVRRHITGSAYKEYLKTGMYCGIILPTGLKDGDSLDFPIFTPTEKTETDDPITFDEMCEQIGTELAEQIRDVSMKIFLTAEARLERQGIILADTKFEFGLDKDGKLVLMDEVLTPDSSRFWCMESFYMFGKIVSYDKQKIRDWMTKEKERIGEYPTILPDWLVEEVAADYAAIYEMITEEKAVI
jgi:phosphoribosylaminoimidazole-succinocarboxamide synthase